MALAARRDSPLHVDHACTHLAELVRINDTLSWGAGYEESFVSATQIEDDGEGIELDAIPDWSMGIRITRRRMDQVDGSLVIAPASAHGTIVVAGAPCAAEPIRVSRRGARVT